MLSSPLLLLTLTAVLISGAPTIKTNCTDQLQQILASVNAWNNDIQMVNVSEFVYDLKQSDENRVRCERKTLCKAQAILNNLTHKVINSTRVKGVLRTLTAYSRQHHCSGTVTPNSTETHLRTFLREVSECTKELYTDCPSPR